MTVRKELGDVGTARLRTVVPALWAALITFGVTKGVLPDGLVPLLHNEAFVGFVVLPLVLGAWHAVWTKVQDYVPDVLVRAALGSAKSPSYQPAHAAD